MSLEEKTLIIIVFRPQLSIARTHFFTLKILKELFQFMNLLATFLLIQNITILFLFYLKNNFLLIIY